TECRASVRFAGCVELLDGSYEFRGTGPIANPIYGGFQSWSASCCRFVRNRSGKPLQAGVTYKRHFPVSMLVSKRVFAKDHCFSHPAACRGHQSVNGASVPPLPITAFLNGTTIGPADLRLENDLLGYSVAR